MIKHILFSSDGSEASRKARQYLKDFAAATGAAVSLVHTYDFNIGHIMSRYGASLDMLQELEKQVASSGQKLLEEVKQDLNDAGVEVKNLFIEKGDPGEWIVKIAETQACDLIMMGTRGMGALKSALLGSTSHYVVNHTRIPIYLIPVQTKK